MKIVIFGLSISSAWGNGHATIWRSLLRAMVKRGHQVVFFERDVPYYAKHRDYNPDYDIQVNIYQDWQDTIPYIRQHLANADVGIITSYCPDGIEATEALLTSKTVHKLFYDLDTPVTLKNINEGKELSYIGNRKLRDFDMVMSYTGGEALRLLKTELEAKNVVPLYGSVDPDYHSPTNDGYSPSVQLSYLGTYAEDRQEKLDRFLIRCAEACPNERFVIGGALFPEGFPWFPNIMYENHVPPTDHLRFYRSSRFTLNITRDAMARFGYCPSGRLFEAAACGVPMISDSWEGIDQFFKIGSEIVVVTSTQEVLNTLSMSEHERLQIAHAAREKVLSGHTGEKRAIELEAIVNNMSR